MRSLLFVPADSPRKLARALSSGADLIVIDLEDAVAPAAKPAAREAAAAFVAANRAAAGRPLLYVRVNGAATGLMETDLDTVMPAGPDGIMLPKCGHGTEIAQLSAMLAAREALAGIDDGATAIVALATETAASLFGLGSYAGTSRRLAGLAFAAEDLAADLGAGSYLGPDGALTDPFRVARALCLAGAVAAGVAPIDGVHPDFRDAAGLRAAAEAAARDGFTAKLAIHPDQVAAINAAFTPAADDVETARRLVAAFASAGDAGVVAMDGRMFDRPHLVRAERLLARAAALGAIV